MKSREALLADPFENRKAAALWTSFCDEFLPQWVKDRYSPRESWKGKPFTTQDAEFFSKGITELSESFTLERAHWRQKQKMNYFSHPRFRSAYLLYFLPLQMSKLLSVYSSHPSLIQKTLESAEKDGELRFLDLGSGPATATLAFMILLQSQYPNELSRIPKLKVLLVDHNSNILRDAEELILAWKRFSGDSLPSEISVRSLTIDLANFVPREPAHFAVLANALNEWTPKSDDFQTRFQNLAKHSAPGGLLVVEPASRETSQNLSQIRDLVVEAKFPIAAPCPHDGRCPLSRGPDYCHFSPQYSVAGKWFSMFHQKVSAQNSGRRPQNRGSRVGQRTGQRIGPRIGKWSYLWLSTAAEKLQKPGHSLVVSDPIQLNLQNRRMGKVLLCAPDRAIEKKVSLPSPLRRGAWISDSKHDTKPNAKSQRR